MRILKTALAGGLNDHMTDSLFFSFCIYNLRRKHFQGRISGWEGGRTKHLLLQVLLQHSEISWAQNACLREASLGQDMKVMLSGYKRNQKPLLVCWFFPINAPIHHFSAVRQIFNPSRHPFYCALMMICVHGGIRAVIQNPIFNTVYTSKSFGVDIPVQQIVQGLVLAQWDYALTNTHSPQICSGGLREATEKI